MQMTHDQDQMKPSPVPGSGKTEVPNLRGKTIIVAEDDPNCFAIVHYLLKKTGADIIHVEDGQQLMTLMEDTCPDLILLDIIMPEMDGHDCLKAIRKNGNSNPKIIMQSAYSAHEQSDRLKDAGADGYLMKPVRKAELFPILERLLRDGLNS